MSSSALGSSTAAKAQAHRRYNEIAQRHRPKPRIARNALVAFATGGVVCLVGQGLTDLYAAWLGMGPKEAGAPAVATVIAIACVLTGLGWFDRLAAFAGAGVGVPVTGFANSVASAALEFKREGFVLGVGAKMFSLAGSVVMFGVVTAFFVGLVAALLG